MVEKKDDVLTDDVIEELDRIGNTSVNNFNDNLIPIENSEQYTTTGFDKQEQYVGHVCYSEHYNCLIYQSRRRRNHILQSVEGKGIAISEDIYNTITGLYDVEYVFIGFEARGDVQVIPVNQFKYDWKTEGWDKQLYARMDEGVKRRLENKMNELFTDIPRESSESITFDRYRHSY